MSAKDYLSELHTDIARSGIKIGSRRLSYENIVGWVTALPVLLLYLSLSIIPILFAIWASFHEIPLAVPQWEFIGIQNYQELLSESRFYSALWNGVVFMVGSTVVQSVVGVWMALVLNRINWGQRVMTAVVFAGYLIPTIVVVMVALFMMDLWYGPIPIWLESLGLWNTDNYLLGSSTLALPIVILTGSWKFSVFITIIVLAQLRSIPGTFYEAAKTCGATHWQMFWHITFPRIKGAILIAVFLRSIFMFNKFDVIWMMTSGGPGRATETLPIYAYRSVFQAGEFAWGNTISVVMFLFLFFSAIIYFTVFNPTEEVETEA